MPKKVEKSKPAHSKKESGSAAAKKQKKAGSTPEPQQTLPIIGDSWEFFLANAKTMTLQNSPGETIFPISTIKDFWEWFNNIDVCSLKSEKDSFYLMRKGITPKWEDPKNILGGQVRYIFVNSQIANDFFTELAILTIGEAFQEKLMMITPKKTIQVNGLCVVKQKNDTYNFQIWYNYEPNPATTETESKETESKETTNEPKVYSAIKLVVEAKSPKIKEWLTTYKIQTNFKSMGTKINKEREQRAKSTKPLSRGQTPKSNDHEHFKHYNKKTF